MPLFRRFLRFMAPFRFALLIGLAGIPFETRADGIIGGLPRQASSLSECEQKALAEELARPSLEELARGFRLNPDAAREFFAKLEGDFVELVTSRPGAKVHFDFVPAKNGSSEVLVKLGGIGSSIARMKANRSYVDAHSQTKNILFISVLGQDMTLLQEFLDTGRVEQRYPARLQKAVLHEAVGLALAKIDQSRPRRAALDRHYWISALSWGGWLTMDYAADPEYNGAIDGIIFEDPGVVSLDRYLMDSSSNAVLDMLEIQESVVEFFGVFGLLNTPRIIDNTRMASYRQALRAQMLRAYPDFFGQDDVQLEGVLSMIVGLNRVNGTRQIGKIPGRIRIRYLIAGQSYLLPPRLHYLTASAALEREGGQENTSIEILPDSPHDLTRVDSSAFHQAIAARSYRDGRFQSGWSNMDNQGNSLPLTNSEAHSLLIHWQSQWNLRQNWWNANSRP